MLLVLAGGMVLATSTRAQPGSGAGNPYAALAARNVFGLSAPRQPVVTPVDNAPAEVITPNGIISILGTLQVLFKTSGPAAAGQPSKESSYLLSVGERQDEIEVLHIDQQTAVITFDNHGVVQKISLAEGRAAGPGEPETYGPGRPQFVGAIGQGRIPPYFLTSTDPKAPAEIPKTREQQMSMIEELRAFYKSHNDPRAATLPPTALTPDPQGAPKP